MISLKGRLELNSLGLHPQIANPKSTRIKIESSSLLLFTLQKAYIASHRDPTLERLAPCPCFSHAHDRIRLVLHSTVR
jgi:hypothetical protein